MQTPVVKHRRTLFVTFGLLVISISAYWLLLELDLSLRAVQDLAQQASQLVAQAPLVSFLVACLVYITVCSVPFPLVSVVTILLGYLFGFAGGLFITSFGSAIGGLLLFLLARRFISRAAVQRLVTRFPPLEPATESQDFWFAAGVRFIPGLPFFIPSLVFSLTRISALKFYFSTQLGLLLTMGVYVNAGDSLANLTSVSDVFSVRLIVSMLLLAALPIVFRVCQHYRRSE